MVSRRNGGFQKRGGPRNPKGYKGIVRGLYRAPLRDDIGVKKISKSGAPGALALGLGHPAASTLITQPSWPSITPVRIHPRSHSASALLVTSDGCP